MSLTNEQIVANARSAMQALIGCTDSIILTPEDIAKRAWDIAEAMSTEYIRRASPGLAAQSFPANSATEAGLKIADNRAGLWQISK